MDQSNLLENIQKISQNLTNKFRPKTREGKVKKTNTLDSVSAPFEGRESTLNVFKSEVFPVKATKGKGLNILTPKQLFQRLPIVLAQVKAGKIPENLIIKQKKNK